MCLEAVEENNVIGESAEEEKVNEDIEKDVNLVDEKNLTDEKVG